MRVFIVKKQCRLAPEVEEIIAVRNTYDHAVQSIQKELLAIYAEWRYSLFTIEEWLVDSHCVKTTIFSREQNKELVEKAGGRAD